MKTPPERATVSTCIGCGAMSLPGSCPGSCGSERRLDLVTAAEYDETAAAADAAEADVLKLRGVVERFAASGDDASPEDALREARGDSRAVLGTLTRGGGDDDSVAPVSAPEEVEIVTTWWCPRCGGIDAPQPCIGVCIHRPVDWVSADVYESAVARAAGLRDERARLLRVVRSLAWVTPRPGCERRNRRALRAHARQALAAR